jgi:arylsulfatase A-like enzyme
VNIVLLIADTFRRDHLPCYGNPAVIAPNFTALARDALVFDSCFAASFPTVPARADVMTGRYTFTYLDWAPLPQSEITLAQQLSNTGYLTFGIADTPFLMRNGYGYDRGFQDFEWIRGQRSGPEHDDVVMRRRSEQDYFAPMTLKGAVDWLERHHRQKFFLYIDTWDPHEPWDPPDYYVRSYYPAYAGERIAPNYWDWREDGFTQKDLEIAHACYCGEITMVDRWFGILMERLSTLGLLSDTAIFFTSDHGFYFGEHDQFGKRRFRWPGNLPIEEGFKRGMTLGQGLTYRSPLHSEVTRVPLLVYLPNVKSKRIGGLVSLPDLMPTILELAGVDIPQSVQARSLVPLIQGQTTQGHDLVVTSAPFEEVGNVSKTVDDQGRETVEISPSTITDGTWDLLYAIQDAPVELYRTVEDPTHKQNVFSGHRDAAATLHAKFVNWLEYMGTKDKFLKPRRKL